MEPDTSETNEKKNNTQPLSGKEAYEARKREKEAAKGHAVQVQKVSGGARRIATILIVIAVLLAAGYGLYLWAQSLAPQSEDLSRAVPIMGREHIPVGSPRPAYNSNPPTSGPHYDVPARGGFRGNEEIADEHIVHSLEHGFVWISYQPDVPESVVGELERFARSNVIIIERAQNDTDIALAAWGRIDAFDLPPDRVLPAQRIEDFIARYLNRGPERVTNHGGV